MGSAVSRRLDERESSGGSERADGGTGQVFGASDYGGLDVRAGAYRGRRSAGDEVGRDHGGSARTVRPQFTGDRAGERCESDGGAGACRASESSRESGGCGEAGEGERTRVSPDYALDP